MVVQEGCVLGPLPQSLFLNFSPSLDFSCLVCFGLTLASLLPPRPSEAPGLRAPTRTVTMEFVHLNLGVHCDSGDRGRCSVLDTTP